MQTAMRNLFASIWAPKVKCRHDVLPTQWSKQYFYLSSKITISSAGNMFNSDQSSWLDTSVIFRHLDLRSECQTWSLSIQRNPSYRPKCEYVVWGCSGCPTRLWVPRIIGYSCFIAFRVRFRSSYHFQTIVSYIGFVWYTGLVGLIVDR